MQKISDLVEFLNLALDCSDRYLAAFVGITESYLKYNLDKEFYDDTNMVPLYVFKLLQLKSVTEVMLRKFESAEVIKSYLDRSIFSDIEGNMDSIRTSIIQNKYPLRTLHLMVDLLDAQYRIESKK